MSLKALGSCSSWFTVLTQCSECAVDFIGGSTIVTIVGREELTIETGSMIFFGSFCFV